MIAWLAVVLGIDSTADHAIIYTNLYQCSQNLIIAMVLTFVIPQTNNYGGYNTSQPKCLFLQGKC